MGDGSSPRSLSRTGIRRALCRGCRFPDAILHGQRSYRPRSRAVRQLAPRGFRVRLFSSLQLVVAPPACKPGQDTPAIGIRVLTTGRGTAIAGSDAFTHDHGSRLFSLKLLFRHSPAVSFVTSPVFGSFSRNVPGSRVLPDAYAPFVRLSAFFFGRF